MPGDVLVHLIRRDDWERARAAGVYAPPSLSTEGFIHLSTEAQWRSTVRRFFSGVPDLLLLDLDPERVGEVRFEAADGDRFPHLYAPLPLDAVRAVHAVGLVNGEPERLR